MYATMRFLFSPVIGNLSDRFGRRPILLVSLATLAVDYVIMGFAPTLFWLFIGRLLSGASAATLATANAYVADVTPEAERAGRYGLIGAAWGVGFVVGPALGGALGELGPRVPFFVAAGLAAMNMATAISSCRKPCLKHAAAPLSWAAPTRSAPCAPFAATRLYSRSSAAWPSTSWPMTSIRPHGPTTSYTSSHGRRSRSASHSASSACPRQSSRASWLAP